MANDDFDRELDRFEVDRLVKQLAAKRKAAVPPPMPASGHVPSAFTAFGSPTAVPAAQPQPATPPRGTPIAQVKSTQTPIESPAPPAQQPAAYQRKAPGTRWSTSRLLMPSVRAALPRRGALALASSIKGLHLPDFHQMSLPALPRIGWPILTDAQLEVITARMFMVLGVVLSVAMVYWPYSHAHSWGLALYLFAVALVVVTGVWGSKLTWDARLGRSHVITIVTMIWGLTLAVITILPHLGFGIG